MVCVVPLACKASVVPTFPVLRSSFPIPIPLPPPPPPLPLSSKGPDEKGSVCQHATLPEDEGWDIRLPTQDHCQPEVCPERGWGLVSRTGHGALLSGYVNVDGCACLPYRFVGKSYELYYELCRMFENIYSKPIHHLSPIEVSFRTSKWLGRWSHNGHMTCSAGAAPVLPP